MDEEDEDDGFGLDLYDFLNKPEESVEEEIEEIPLEDLLHKNTESFRCLAQVEISRSSIFRHPLYNFPEIPDPLLQEALFGDDPPPVYDDVGCERYTDLCKEQGIMPFRRVLNSLLNDYLDLKYFHLTLKQMRTICGTLQFNRYVTHVSFEENFLCPESVACINAMLEENDTIINLDMKNCQIGHLGAERFDMAFEINKTLQELDLSYNNLGDDGITTLVESLKATRSLKKLNLSHNNLADKALFAMRTIVEDCDSLRDLDLSWNLLYDEQGMTTFLEALAENVSLKSLNLAWNGIGDKYAFRAFKAHLPNTHIEHLDLSNNRITAPVVRPLKTALKNNESLVTLNLGFNPLKSEEVEFLANLLAEKKKPPNLCFIDFGQTWVKKSFINVEAKIIKKGFKVSYGGIYSNYVIKGPNFQEMLLHRARVVGLTQKKKKFRKDIGSFLLTLPDTLMKKDAFDEWIKGNKIKLDEDLLLILMKNFEGEKKRVDIPYMKEMYMRLYPDTKPPEKKKKGKKGKKKGGTDASEPTTTEPTTEVTIEAPSEAATDTTSAMPTITEVTTEAPTETGEAPAQSTEAPKEPTEAPTEPTEAPSEAPTEVATEAQSEAATEAPTELPSETEE